MSASITARIVAVSLALWAGAAVSEIRMESGPLAAGGEPFRLVISGHQANSCVPELSEVRREDGAILVLAHRGAKGCGKADTEWQILLDDGDLGLDAAPLTEPVPVRFLVSEGGDPVRVARLKAFDLLVPAGREVRPEAGLWWPDPDGPHGNGGPGTGYSVELQGEELLLISNLYAAGGDPDWLFSSGRLDDALVRAELLSLYGGQRLFTDYLPPETALSSGRVLVYFHTPATATAWFVAPASEGPDPDLLVQPVSLVRYAFALGPRQRLLSGRWLLIDDESLDGRELVLRAAPAARHDELRFADTAEGLAIDCAGGSSVAPPERCEMSDSKGLLATLDEVGLNQLSGLTRDGRRITLIRWQR